MFALWSEEGIVSVLFYMVREPHHVALLDINFQSSCKFSVFPNFLGIKIKGMGYRSKYLFNTDLLDLIKISNFLWQTYSFIIFWMLCLATIIFDSKIQNCHGFSDVQYFLLYLKFIMFSVNYVWMVSLSTYLHFKDFLIFNCVYACLCVYV